MKIYDMQRREGKTSTCILELARNPKAILLVGNIGMKMGVIEDYSEIRDIENRVVAVSELDSVRGKLGLFEHDIIVDELDYVLSVLLGHKVKIATVTSDSSV